MLHNLPCYIVQPCSPHLSIPLHHLLCTLGVQRINPLCTENQCLARYILVRITCSSLPTINMHGKHNTHLQLTKSTINMTYLANKQQIYNVYTFQSHTTVLEMHGKHAKLCNSTTIDSRASLPCRGPRFVVLEPGSQMDHMLQRHKERYYAILQLQYTLKNSASCVKRVGIISTTWCRILRW
jgi:hypothetical protein